MSLKDFLLEGGRISHPYKRVKGEWVGEAKLYGFAGYYSKPKIIFDSGYERIEWNLDQIDEAINHFQKVVYNPANLHYKMFEAVVEFTSKGEEVDLDDEKDYERVNTVRKAKILQAIKQADGTLR